jgi:hypothetical protein
MRATVTRSPAATSRLARLRDRLARSGRVFLLGLVVACGIEVLVDWNSTLFEINVLRGRMRDRGLSYVAILSKASAAPMRAGDGPNLAVLSSGVFDDEDVLAVRFFDLAGHPLHERVAEAGGAEFQRRRGAALLAYFEYQMSRDVQGILRDPAEQERRMASSRWRDFPQRWNDLVAAVVGRFSKPKAPKQGVAPALYQDRLRTEDRKREETVTYAFGTVVDEKTRPLGVVMVVFSMERTNDAISLKYLKGAGMVAFFVALIIVQNMTGRRDKLRLLEIEGRSARARAALDGAAPDAPVTAERADGAEVFATIVRAAGRVDGFLWDAAAAGEGAVLALAIDPEGEGLDAAGVALGVREAFRARRAAGVSATLDEELEALAAVVGRIPLAGGASVLLLRIDGVAFEAVASSFAGLRLVRGDRIERVDGEPCPDSPVFGALARASGSLGDGALLLAVAEASLVDAVAKRALDEAGAGDDVRGRALDELVTTLAADATMQAHGADRLVLVARGARAVANDANDAPATA